MRTRPRPACSTIGRGGADRKERVGKVRGDVGFRHEAYIVPEGSYESIHVDMPPFGLAAATGVPPVGNRGRRAAQRFAHRSSGAAGGPSEGGGEPRGACRGVEAGTLSVTSRKPPGVSRCGAAPPTGGPPRR